MSKGSSNQTQSMVSEPWGPLQGYMTRVLPRIEDWVLNAPREYYPGSTVVPFAPQSETALAWTEQRAMQGSPLLRNVQGLVNETLGGAYLPGAGGSNPWLDASVAKAQGAVRGALDSQFAAGGRYGSGAHAAALADSYGDIAAGIYGGAYESERARQMQAALLAPELARADYDDIAMLAAAGAQREGKAAEEMQDIVNRFNFAQDERANRIRDYLALLNGGFSGTGTQSRSASGASSRFDLGDTLLRLGSMALA